MSQFAPVAPIQILEEMAKQKVLGTYHLLLAHHVLEAQDRFAVLFDGYKQSTIIMDNSLVELKEAASDATTLEACEVIGNQHWVIPVLRDVMGDGEATRRDSTDSYSWWQTHAPHYPLMVVAQGKDWNDFTATVDHFLLSGDFPAIEYVGVPRKLVETLGTRQVALQYIDAVSPMTNVHLLGFSDDVCDDIICANMPSVEGIDSAVPLRYAYSSGANKLYTPSMDIPPRPADWFEKGTFTQDDAINCFNIRKWVA